MHHKSKAKENEIQERHIPGGKGQKAKKKKKLNFDLIQYFYICFPFLVKNFFR